MENQNPNNPSSLSNNFTYKTAKMAEDHDQPELRELLEENLKYTKAMYWSVEKVRRHLFWQRVFTITYILVLIVAPLILAAVYLPSFIKNYLGDYLGAYSDLLQGK